MYMTGQVILAGVAALARLYYAHPQLERECIEAALNVIKDNMGKGADPVIDLLQGMSFEQICRGLVEFDKDAEKLEKEGKL
jgi:hypothetical protein